MKRYVVLAHALGFVLYVSIPSLAHAGQMALFVAFICIILSMYGGGFSTVPAYLADLFGTQMVGAIHGRLLTAWAAAGVLGPILIGYIREYQIAQGVPKAQAYDVMVRPIADKHFMTDDELAHEKRLASERDITASSGRGGVAIATGGVNPAVAMFAWAAVGIPLLMGVWITLQKAVVLFK